MKEELLSVGIDIGTSTTQLVFSKITIENMASSYSVPRIEIADKELIYKSTIYFTPLLNQTTIDCDAIKQIIETEYQKAGVKKQDIQTGAVIITGETARKENAREVLQTLSGFAGDFVVATAGPDLESIIAGKGAGAHLYSEEHRTSVLNLDIGGGTTNLALFDKGTVTDTGCFDVGGRLIKADEQLKITYIAPKINTLLKQKSIPLAVGDTLTQTAVQPVIDVLTDVLLQAAGLKEPDAFYDLFVTHKGLQLPADVKCISFSGGVADAIYSDRMDNPFQYRDIGILLGQSIRTSALCKKLRLVRGSETIRATVVGAGSHTTEISGSTIFCTDGVLPLKNIPVLKLNSSDEQQLTQALQKKLQWYGSESEFQNTAICFDGVKHPSFTNIQYYADCLLEGGGAVLHRHEPLIVVVANDMAKALGHALYNKTGRQSRIICIDGIHLHDGDYIDIGRPVADGAVVPVVVKTLVFH